MSRSLISQIVVKAYEDFNLSLEDIAKEHDISVTEVKICLMQESSVYRANVRCEGAPAEIDFTTDDLMLANRVIRETAEHADDPHLKFRAASYIRDDKKGRREIVKAIQNIGFDIAKFNAWMRQAQVAMEVKAESEQGPGPAPQIENSQLKQANAQVVEV